MTPRELTRLQAVDAALGSAEGLHVETLARRHKVSAKTIRRDLALLRRVVGPTRDVQVLAANAKGRSWRHWYDGHARLFAANAVSVGRPRAAADDAIRAALERVGGKVAQAAAALGVSRETVYAYLRRQPAAAE